MKALIAALGFVVGAVILAHWFDYSAPRQSTSTTYRGQITGYDVEIFEAKTDVASLVVHLYPLGDDGKQKSDANLAHITGHRSEDQKEWNKIFFCGMPESKYGCNAFENRMGQYTWAPCNAERDLKNPFSIGEVVGALRSLDNAIIAVHNREHAIKE
ncbi:MAG: hypothetical protein A2805_01010 [Candidatus Andersenbacteria bacterium RIFCSPHIGHO2_01_FULL_46_36]|uniref:Uncharacterized protein n=1 Tax=Candidatus Andersenbacteria bacterium RIFCSPHIGHO2_12_FULL_45_11 TaxID=1797281 RepID=A0A1G1X0W9_9BACT|nr:MAG: hypothetical protein A2805_01010 [Candidatus Andersenbacteria bacterium RIFCSPHIGHO2_01_FULL_46_36]OGY33655.1 MAG: hypothetical protein A3D99_03870 [Candidatus Andersenbacteria bacterium RIFCSPHIGHO2_12_FULL_45_11]